MFTIFLALSLLITPVLADTYQDLHNGSVMFDAVLTQDREHHASDQAEISVEAREEFFPGSDGESSSSRRGDVSGSQFVTFRLNGVPYVLKDVPLGAWFAPYVRDVADGGIVSGYRDAQGIPTGIFGPERNVSLEELAKMALGAAAVDPASCTEPPKNPAAQKSWSRAYIACAEKMSFAVFVDGTADIARPATRAEVVMTILQAFGVALRDTPPPGISMKDVTPATLFSAAIYTGLESGIVSGDTDSAGNLQGTFRPESPMNRAEVSKIISLAVQIYGGE